MRKIKMLEEQILRLRIKLCNGEHTYVLIQTTKAYTGTGVRRIEEYQCKECEKKLTTTYLI